MATGQPASPLRCDVLVIGGGNAGLCAALAAREAGASVLLLESAPRSLRGGNTRHGRNLRLAHDHPTLWQHGCYTAQDFWGELVRVTGGVTDAALSHQMIAASADAAEWMHHHGARFEQPARARKTAFLRGGGKALLNAYYLTAERLGVSILYDCRATELLMQDGKVERVTVLHDDTHGLVHPHAVVLACGGMQANADWRADVWGEDAAQVVIRGAPHADGRLLRHVLDLGAMATGDAKLAHVVAIDARAPVSDGGIVTRIDGINLGIVVDQHGRRIIDPRGCTGPEQYAIWGGLIAQSPSKIAYAIHDANSAAMTRPSIYPPICAPTLDALAVRLGIDPQALASSAEGTTLCVPPFSGTPMRAGLTFAYLGVRIDATARVQSNLFAAGMAMAGNILGRGYLAGIGLTISTVFGRIAGQHAARCAGLW